METSWTIFEMYIAIFGLIVTVGILNDKKGKGATQLLLNSTRARLAGCASRFNQQVKALQREYKSEKKHGARLKTYEIKYNVAKIDYDREANEIIREWKQAKKDDMWWRGFWKIVIVTGVISLLGACTEALVNIEENSVPASMEQMTQAREDKVWTAQSIPMPHLTDGRRYVSNPDGIVSDETARRLDAQLKQLDDSLGIESVLVIVSRVENGDIFRFAQDIFDIYKVGKNDRGLVMVLAYDDHKFRSHTGRSLEADLTDAECFRLQERYLIPSMKAEMPDSGLIYYVESVYNLLQGKELPVMSELRQTNSDDDEDAILPSIYFFLLFVWMGIYMFAARRHGWNMKHYYNGRLTKNPFINNGSVLATGYVVGSILNGGGGRSHHGGGFGGGSFGGGFSGGSSGGGGATSSW